MSRYSSSASSLIAGASRSKSMVHLVALEVIPGQGLLDRLINCVVDLLEVDASRYIEGLFGGHRCVRWGGCAGGSSARGWKVRVGPPSRRRRAGGRPLRDGSFQDFVDPCYDVLQVIAGHVVSATPPPQRMRAEFGVAPGPEVGYPTSAHWHRSVGPPS